MRSLSLNITITALITFCALWCAAPGQATPRSAVTTSPAARHASSSLRAPFASPGLRLCGVMQDHVYLTDPGSAAAVDVTKTLYVAQGQTYAVLNGVSIAIVLDHVNSAVLNLSGQSIGFILRIAEPGVALTPAVYTPGASSSRGGSLSGAKAARQRPSTRRNASGSAAVPAASVRNPNLA